MAAFRTPKQFRDMTIGKSYDTDSYPRSNPYQCWDLFDYFCRLIGFDGSRKCANTNLAGDLWALRDAAGYDYRRAFDYVYDPAEFRTGDWIFWPQHVAMFYEGMELGQNQPSPWVTEIPLNRKQILGAMRWRGWTASAIAGGKSAFEVEGRKYSLWRMTGRDRIGVISPGLHQVARIQDMDVPGILREAVITGANFFQMKDDQPDPYGTTYGDLSSPLCGVYQSLANQDSTLFYDLQTGMLGDCKDVLIDSSHDVFSPCLVWPNSKGNWEYARMVGFDHTKRVSRYTFLLAFSDGYALGIAEQDSTPEQIRQDFLSTDMLRIAFLDGGGSAQAGFWNDGKMEYIQTEERKVASALCIYRLPETAPVIPPAEDDNVPDPEPVLPPEEDGKDDDMSQNQQNQEQLQPAPVPGWKDPEADKVTVLDRIVALLSVKSIITVACLYLFGVLVLNDKISADQFMTVFSVVIAFYFGTTFSKGSGK